ncbi:hypothetical protein PR048_016652 [Dryococelus australis]|uniref:Ribosomal protein S14 n=1 Tax=Dryococelus australis TaxID=614101 RepID=A0ABQ9H7A4_9NEOP|nr:hypothetical protein PR048_016652 [Dryococelus australis]
MVKMEQQRDAMVGETTLPYKKKNLRTRKHTWQRRYRIFRTRAVSTLASHQGKPGSIPSRVTGFSQVGIVPDDAVGLRVFPFPPPLHSGAAPYSLQSPTSALKTSLLRAAQIFSLTNVLPAITVLTMNQREALVPTNQPLHKTNTHVSKSTGPHARADWRARSKIEEGVGGG